jgi:hypothetical protein
MFRSGSLLLIIISDEELGHGPLSAGDTFGEEK